MSKTRFRIIAIKCLNPEHTTATEALHVRRMQRSLYKSNRWYKFYQLAEISNDGNDVQLPADFYDDEMIFDTDSMCISISAIVGENGSGKSSILDMIIRILNNASTALLGERPQYAAAEHVHYIENVYGSILFIQDNELKCLEVKGRNVDIFHYNVIQSDEASDCFSYKRQNKDKQCWLEANESQTEELLRTKVKKLKELGVLFYTIVCNYSIYAYNPNDYKEEFTNENKIAKIKPKQNYQEYPYLKCWLTGLFHKNDGYQMPIVLNPMRINGVINVPKENELAKERLLSMLFYQDKKNKDELLRFPFRIINRDHIIVGLELNPKPDAENYWTAEWMIQHVKIGKQSKLYREYENISKEIIDYLKDMEGINDTTANQKLACRYLVYKIFKIGLNYKKYNKILSNLRKKDCSIELLHKHLDELIADQSHITVKFRRTLMYLKYKIYTDDKHSLNLKDLLVEATKCAKKNNNYKGLPKREPTDFLPPPIFDVEFIIVQKEHIDNKGNYKEENTIPFWSLSSGERQIAYLVSNFVYHLVNINSVHTIVDEFVAGLPLLKYKYINVIFDEIELYFHPDLQRRFLSLVLSALRNIHIENIEGVNILLVTHSPFILSDLPKSNVLALSKKDEMIGETFCANIHEMLGQSFFMDYSIGQIAQEQVEEIFGKYNSLSNKNLKNVPTITNDDWKRYEYIASIIGDEYLCSCVQKALKKLSEIRKE